MTRSARPALLACLFLLLPGCAFFGRLATGAFERPTLAYESWSTDALDLDGITIGLHYRLENPNGVSLDLRRLSYALEVEGQHIASGELPVGVELRANGATPLAIPVRLRWRDIPGFMQLFLAKDRVAYRVTGNAGVGSPIGTVDLPFDHRDEVSLPRPPGIGIEGITVRNASLSDLSIELNLRIDNRNAFPLPVGALAYGLRLGERDLLSGGSHPLAAVPAGGSARVRVPIRLSLSGAASILGELLQGAQLRLRGLAGFGDLQVPVDAGAELKDPPPAATGAPPSPFRLEPTSPPDPSGGAAQPRR